MISETYLRSYGAIEKNYKKGSLIFSVGSLQENYYQIIEGIVKLSFSGLDERGKTFKLLRKGECISLYSIFVEMPLLHNALTITDCRIMIISKKCFFKMIMEERVLMFQILRDLSRDMNSASQREDFYFTDSPELKLHQLLSNLKHRETDQEKFSYEVKLTMQQIADFINIDLQKMMLCIKSLEKQSLLKVINDKLYF